MKKLAVFAPVLVLVSLAALIVACADCASGQSVGSAALGSVIDCTKADAAKVGNELGPVLEALLAQAVAGDQVEWAPIKSLTKSFSVELGGCVLANTVANLSKPKPVDPAAPKSGQLEVDVAALRAGFRELAAERWPGKSFHTLAGDL